MPRFNLILTPEEIKWLDRLADTGASIGPISGPAVPANDFEDWALDLGIRESEWCIREGLT